MAFSNKALTAAAAASQKADALRAELIAAGVLHTVATSYTVALASSTGIVGTAVNFTATPVGGGWPAGETLSPALGGIAGTFSPQTASPAAGSTTPATFALTPGAAGAGTVTVTASPSMGTPAGVQITVSAAAPVALPTITTTTSGATFVAGAAAGVVVATLSAPPAGATRALLPGDGRLVLNSAGTAIVVGMTAASAGTISATVKDTKSGSADSPVLTVPVTVTVAQSVPPPAATPTNGATLHSFNFVNWGTASSVGMARQGVVFKPGAIPAGSSVKVQRAGADVAVQFNERRSWPDGSLAFAVMHIRDTPLAAGVRQAYNLVLVLGAPFTDVAGTTPDQIAAGHAFSMTFANHTSQNDTTTTPVGSGTSTASLATHMATATRREAHHVGPVCDGAVCWGMVQDATGGTLDAHLKVNWEVDRWKNVDGSTYAIEIACQPAQDWYDVAGKTRRNYDATLLDGATTIETYAAVPHTYNCSWVTVQNRGGFNRGRAHWVGGACPTLSYEPDRAYWIAAGFVAPLNLTRQRTPMASPGGGAGNAVYLPMSNQEHRPSIDGTGAYMGRGVMPNCDNLAFLSQSPSDVAIARINAKAGQHVFWHHRSAHQRTRPGEAADVANTIVALSMAGPATLPAFDFTAQGLPAPIDAYCDTRNDPAFKGNYVVPQGGRVYFDTSYGDGIAGGNSRSNDASHAVNFCYFMYLLEGKRYDLEATLDLAQNTLHQGTNPLNNPYVIWEYGSGTIWHAVTQFATGEERNTGWAQNLVFHAAGVVPDSHPASPYFKRLVQQQGLYIKATLDGMPPDWKLSGVHPWTDSAGVHTCWELAFCALAAYSGWRLTKDTNIRAWADYTSQWAINNVRDRISQIREYRGSNQHNPGVGYNIRTNPYYTGSLEIDEPTANAAAATGILTITKGYLPDNGAILYASAKNYATGDTIVPPELTRSTPYYVRDGSGTTFRLAASPGGIAISFAADRTEIHFLYDNSYNPNGANPFGDTNADDTPCMNSAVIVEAYCAGAPTATSALVARTQNFITGCVPVMASWASWDYDVPASIPATSVAATLPPVVPNLRLAYNAADLFWVRWDMPANMGTTPLFKVEVSGDGGSTYTVLQASTPMLACQVTPGTSAPRAQTVRVTAINDAGASATPATMAVTMKPYTSNQNFPLVLSGAAGPLTGNAVVAAWNGGDVSHFALDGSGDMLVSNVDSTRGILQNAGTVSADGTLLVILAAGSDRILDAVLRASGSGSTADGYLISVTAFNNGTQLAVAFYVCTNGNFAQLGSTVFPNDLGGMNWSYGIAGSRLSFAVNGQELAAATDTTFTAAGFVGLGIGGPGPTRTKLSQVTYQASLGDVQYTDQQTPTPAPTPAPDSTLTGLPSTIVAGQPLSAVTYTPPQISIYFVLYNVAGAVEEGLRWPSGVMSGALNLLIPQTAGAYTVRAYDAATAGNKVYESAQINVTASPGALPATPTQTADTGATSSGVIMNWTATGTSYRVLARHGVGTVYGSLADATVTTNSYTFTGLAANSSSRAIVIPQNANGYGTPTGQLLSFTTA